MAVVNVELRVLMVRAWIQNKASVGVGALSEYELVSVSAEATE